MTDRSSRRVLGALLAAAALVALAACGGSTPQQITPAAQDGSPQSDPVVIRMALAPDPVWQWLSDSGTAAEWEASRNIRIEASSPFDQFSAFAGGHADVVVVNALEVTQFVEQSDREPVIVGQFTNDRSILAVRRTSRAETLDDLVEARITVDSALGSTLLWGVIADELHDLDFRVGSDDFDLVVVESASVADLVLRGDVEACICLPDFSVSALADSQLRPLYDGRPAATVYAEDVRQDAQERPMADVFVVDKQWHAQNREAVAALLGLWEIGLRNWTINKEQFISDYPHLFSVQSDEDIAWLTSYVKRQDWVAPSVNLTEQDEAAHADIFARMQRIGLIDEAVLVPELDLSYPTGT